MQSYSQAMDPTQTIDDLETLGDRLVLPDGCAIKCACWKLNQKWQLMDLAYMISDEYRNAYMKVLP